MPEHTNMMAIAIERPGAPEMLVARHCPLPRPGPGEILIRVAAAGVNAPDVSQRRGSYAPPPDASPLPGLEVGGTIAVAATGSGFAVGDPVVALTNGGGYAEYVAVPTGQVLPVPKGWNLLAGAALPETFFTVQQTLVQRAGLAPGMFVLIHGAAGGIGGAAIAISRALGSQPIAVVSSDDKAAYARRLGAAATIVHTREDFVAHTRELTDGKGPDRIIEMAGGETLTRSIEAAARDAHIVLLAAMSGQAAEILSGKLVTKQLTLSGSTLRPQPREAKAAVAAGLLRDVWPSLEDGTIVPPRVRALPLEAAAAAHRALEDRSHYGKLILLTAFGQTLMPTDNSIELMDPAAYIPANSPSA